MRWLRITARTAVVLALAAGAAAEQSAYDPVLAQLGAPLFVRHCAACHGVGGRGDGPAAEAMRKPPADLTAIAARRAGVFPTSEIALFIDGRFEIPPHGSREMPVWGQRFGTDVPDPGLGDSIARGNIASLVEYLKSIQQPPLAPRASTGTP
jgi:mono/diheme cytochrome c family protein